LTDFVTLFIVVGVLASPLNQGATAMVTNAMKLGTLAHKRALETDNAWQIHLEVCFGKRAGDVRYTKEGEGKPGTVLRNLYELRTLAQEMWHAE
jgi:hypothetical protein